MASIRIETPDKFPEMLQQRPVSTVDALFGIAIESIPEVSDTAPWETSVVLSLVASCGYNCDFHHLIYLLQSGQIEQPPRFANNFAWRQENIAELLLHLDNRRRWLPGFHVERKTTKELKRDGQEAEKGLAMLGYLQTLDSAELQHRHRESRDSTMKELIEIAVSLKQKKEDAPA